MTEKQVIDKVNEVAAEFFLRAVGVPDSTGWREPLTNKLVYMLQWHPRHNSRPLKHFRCYLRLDLSVCHSTAFEDERMMCEPLVFLPEELTEGMALLREDHVVPLEEAIEGQVRHAIGRLLMTGEEYHQYHLKRLERRQEGAG